MGSFFESVKLFLSDRMDRQGIALDTQTDTHARAHTHTHTHKLLSCTHSLTPITATRKLCASLALLVCSFITHNDLDDLIDVTRLAESPDLLSETNAGRADSHVSIGLCL